MTQNNIRITEYAILSAILIALFGYIVRYAERSIIEHAHYGHPAYKERLIRLESDVSYLQKTVTEMKRDVKEIKREVNDGFNRVLAAIRAR